MSAGEAVPLPSIDVRTIPPLERHPRIFGLIGSLKPNEHFVVVSDHDPRPLHDQIQARYCDLASWEYLERGPEIWRVRIGIMASSGCGCCCGS